MKPTVRLPVLSLIALICVAVIVNALVWHTMSMPTDTHEEKNNILSFVGRTFSALIMVTLIIIFGLLMTALTGGIQVTRRKQ